MSDVVKDLRSMMRDCNLQARKQDGKILVYNKERNLLSRGALVADLEKAKLLVGQYLHYVRTVGPISLTDFAADHQFRPVSYTEVPNQVDTQSAYFINKEASMSSVSRANLLVAAQNLQNRVLVAHAIRTEVSPKDLRRHLKLKKAASVHLAGLKPAR